MGEGRPFGPGLGKTAEKGESSDLVTLSLRLSSFSLSRFLPFSVRTFDSSIAPHRVSRRYAVARLDSRYVHLITARIPCARIPRTVLLFPFEARSTEKSADSVSRFRKPRATYFLNATNSN